MDAGRCGRRLQLEGADVGAVGPRRDRVGDRGEVERPRKAALVGRQPEGRTPIDGRARGGERHRRRPPAVVPEGPELGVGVDQVAARVESALVAALEVEAERVHLGHTVLASRGTDAPADDRVLECRGRSASPEEVSAFALASVDRVRGKGRGGDRQTRACPAVEVEPAALDSFRAFRVAEAAGLVGRDRQAGQRGLGPGVRDDEDATAIRQALGAARPSGGIGEIAGDRRVADLGVLVESD